MLPPETLYSQPSPTAIRGGMKETHQDVDPVPAMIANRGRLSQLSLTEDHPQPPSTGATITWQSTPKSDFLQFVK